MPKRLVKNSKLTNRQLNELIKYFALEVPASRAAKAMGINRHTTQRIYQVIRRCLARECELESPFGGEVECDESYFGVSAKAAVDEAQKVLCPFSASFGVMAASTLVLSKTYLVRLCARSLERKLFQRALSTKIAFALMMGWCSMGSHYRINHQASFATSRRHHINGIENFWGYAKTKLKSYYGVSRNQFYFYLKEMEFRYNH